MSEPIAILLTTVQAFAKFPENSGFDSVFDTLKKAIGELNAELTKAKQQQVESEQMLKSQQAELAAGKALQATQATQIVTLTGTIAELNAQLASVGSTARNWATELEKLHLDAARLSLQSKYQLPQIPPINREAELTAEKAGLEATNIGLQAKLAEREVCMTNLQVTIDNLERKLADHGPHQLESKGLAIQDEKNSWDKTRTHRDGGEPAVAMQSKSPATNVIYIGNPLSSDKTNTERIGLKYYAAGGAF